MTVQQRIRKLNEAAPRAGARYVLYWARENRRTESNHALAFATELANSLALPVLFYESLTCEQPYANDRLHTFVLEGVPDTAARLKALGIGYVFHLRPQPGDADNALYRLATEAAAVVTDDGPVFAKALHNRSLAPMLGVGLYAVDSSCIVPMSCFEKREYGAYTIRPKIRERLAEFLAPAPPVRVRKRYRGAAPGFHTAVTVRAIPELVAACHIDHTVAPSTCFRGGQREAEGRLRQFLEHRLRRYARDRNEPTAHATSDLSPYLHFGQISALEVALAVREHAAAHKLIADEFLEELIVRRELAFNFARHAPRLDSLDALPDWARATLGKHAKDRRDPLYCREEFELAETHDDLWNAAQKELLLRGKIHGYLRMYWGKKIIEWSATHEEALATMIHLHDRFALDGRDPNTYTGILWCFGLHDRPWGERPVFGMVRWMSRAGMERKIDVPAYIREIEALERTGKEEGSP